MDAAHHLTSRRFGAAALFQRARCAVRLTGPIDDRIGLGDVSARVFERTPLSAQRAPLRAAVFVGLFAPAKLAAGQGVIAACWLRAQPAAMQLDWQFEAMKIQYDLDRVVLREVLHRVAAAPLHLRH